jgi:hypothetical protein
MAKVAKVGRQADERMVVDELDKLLILLIAL